MPVGHLAHQREAETAAFAPRAGFRAEPFLEDLAVKAFRHAWTGVVDGDHDLVLLLGHGYADPSFAARGSGRVQRVVDQVAEKRDQVLTVERTSSHDRVVTHSQLDSSLGSNRGFGEQERAE